MGAWDIVLVVVLALLSVFEWSLIGKPRKPVTRGQALVDILINLALIAWICYKP